MDEFDQNTVLRESKDQNDIMRMILQSEKYLSKEKYDRNVFMVKLSDLISVSIKDSDVPQIKDILG